MSEFQFFMYLIDENVTRKSFKVRHIEMLFVLIFILLVLSIIAFYTRIYLRSLTFQEILVFSFYWTVVEVFGLHVSEIVMEL